MISSLANTVKAVFVRWEDQHDLHRQIALINPNRISACLDLEASLMGSQWLGLSEVASRMGAMRRAISAGETVKPSITKPYITPILLKAFNRAARNEQLEYFNLSPSLMNTETRGYYDRQWGGLVELAPPGGESAIGMGSDAHCFCLGDFLEALAEDEVFKWDARKLIASGGLPGLINQFNILRNLPNYSHHFASRPPDDGDSNKRDERPAPSPVFIPGTLQPGNI